MIRKNTIPDPHPGEKLVAHIRRHWLVFFRIFLFFFSLALIPIALYFFLPLVWPGVLNSPVSYPILLILALIYYLLTLVFFFTAWTDTYLDVWTVTTHRVINREQNGLFNRVVSELHLEDIQDVTAEQKGFLATIFGFGQVYVQTAGERERFVFEQIPQPYETAKIIQKLNENLKSVPHIRV